MINKNIYLNLGCGNDIKHNFINIDKFEFNGVDLTLDLEQDGFPFDDNSIDLVFASHFLEHIRNFDHLIHEVYRVLKIGGILHFIVPSWNSSGTFQDPTHVRFFHPNITMYLENKAKVNYYPKIKFKLIYLARRRTGYYKRLYILLSPIIKLVGKRRFDRYVDYMLLNMYDEIHIKLKKMG